MLDLIIAISEKQTLAPKTIKPKTFANLCTKHPI